MSELRVATHIRGHVASCNGKVELVKARAEQCSVGGSENCLNVQELQAKAEEIRRLKEERLQTFQRDVKERVKRRERTRQKQLLKSASRHVLKEKPPSASIPEIQRKVGPILDVDPQVVHLCHIHDNREDLLLYVRSQQWWW